MLYFDVVRKNELALNANIDDDNPFNSLADYVKHVKLDLENFNEIEYQFLHKLINKYKKYGDLPIKTYECMIRPISILIVLDHIKFSIVEALPEIKDVIKCVIFKIIDESAKNKDFIYSRATNLHNGFENDPNAKDLINKYSQIFSPENE